ncbi:hypothetical protein J7337_008082 [Fusarium musae]|uniref:Uncharacterized protein n=1 Tax=Fusarium musae TaxID=1042133 RepID=A0A9P8DCV7_9HYPO|nr:hypothetical protein J7337_008082 [Fusarium musae]KAG9499623.1 hypothetical protein J7337_008082 [Fusarium musae]
MLKTRSGRLHPDELRATTSEFLPNSRGNIMGIFLMLVLKWYTEFQQLLIIRDSRNLLATKTSLGKKDCHYSSNRSYNMRPEEIRREDSTKASDQKTHKPRFDLIDDDSGICKSDGIPILAQSREGQGLCRDEIQSLKAMTKTENINDSYRYLNTLPPLKPGQLHATTEELDDRESS